MLLGRFRLIPSIGNLLMVWYGEIRVYNFVTISLMSTMSSKSQLTWDFGHSLLKYRLSQTDQVRPNIFPFPYAATSLKFYRLDHPLMEQGLYKFHAYISNGMDFHSTFCNISVFAENQQMCKKCFFKQNWPMSAKHNKRPHVNYICICIYLASN